MAFVDRTVTHDGVWVNMELEETKRTFIVSDTHFFHKHIQRLVGRPEGWSELIIRNWNDVITNSDTVIHLGDVSFGNTTENTTILPLLSGNKKVLLGNHDDRPSRLKRWFEVIDKPTIGIEIPSMSRKIILSHYPCAIEEGWTNFHGHSHGNTNQYTSNANYFDVSIECTGYYPITLYNLLFWKKIIVPA
jgi:calcineurin-like phosphoesterase family protein